MVNTSDTIRLIEDSVIHLVSLTLMKILKRQWIYTVFLKIKAELKKKLLHSEFNKHLLSTQHIPYTVSHWGPEL